MKRRIALPRRRAWHCYAIGFLRDVGRGRLRSALLSFFVTSIVGNAIVSSCSATALPRDAVRVAVSRAVAPAMKKYGIPGMAVGVAIDGHNYVFNFGVSSRATGHRVDAATLFEIGSVSKTFTSTLTSYADVTGKLALSDRVSDDFPILRGSSFDHVRLFNLATHTAGGLPLQFPDDVKNQSDALHYYRRWTPSHASGTYRLYSNPSVMLLGLIASSKLGGDGFASLMERIVFEPLGLRNTFFFVPPEKMSQYAQGYTSEGKPRRMASGPLAEEAYGIRTTAADMLRFIDANMDVRRAGDPLHRALLKTHAGYYRIGRMTQDLIWEQYPYPIPLSALLQGNSEQVLFEDNPVRALRPSSPVNDVLIDKTGSTSGFGAYVAFVPGRKIGVVLLANRAYPIKARVTIAYRILTHLSQ